MRSTASSKGLKGERAKGSSGAGIRTLNRPSSNRFKGPQWGEVKEHVPFAQYRPSIVRERALGGGEYESGTLKAHRKR